MILNKSFLKGYQLRVLRASVTFKINNVCPDMTFGLELWKLRSFLCRWWLNAAYPLCVYHHHCHEIFYWSNGEIKVGKRPRHQLLYLRIHTESICSWSSVKVWCLVISCNSDFIVQWLGSNAANDDPHQFIRIKDR